MRLFRDKQPVKRRQPFFFRIGAKERKAMNVFKQFRGGDGLQKYMFYHNFKGGVCKTTICVEIAAALASSNGFKEKVLIIDLDPQTNAALSLMTENAWQDFAAKKGTLKGFFEACY
jgi:hypothetical protein